MIVKFVGPQGHYIDGVPARDLTQAEWDALTPEKQLEAIDSGLYRVVETKKTAKQAEE